MPLLALELAIQWSEFLEAHARKLYRDELEPGIRAADHLLARMRSGAVQHGASVREIYRHGWTGLNKRERVLVALDVLEACGWVRIESGESSEQGDGPTEIVLLHPSIREIGNA